MLTGALSMLAAVVISFVVIALISSYYRFQHIVQQAESSGSADVAVSTADILRVQLARYFSACARRGASFSLSLIQVNEPSLEVKIDSLLVESIKKAVRLEDIVCIYDGQTVAVLTETEPADSESIIARIFDGIKKDCPEVSSEALRVGISSYPGHGLSGHDLLDVAAEALTETNEDRPVFMPEIIEAKTDEEDEDETPEDEGDDLDGSDAEEAAEGSVGRRKSAMLDELTGVLKPSAVSAYMQRLMNDLRQKRKKAALFCIGVNNVSHIGRIHGEEAVDDVLAGVSKILQDNVRATDLIGRHEKHAFLVLMQVSLENAETVGKRISRLVQQAELISGSKKIKTTITLGVAAYPEHGRNLHLLYKAGQKVLDYNRENDIRAYAVYDPEIHDSMPSKPMKSIKSGKT